MSIFRRKVPGHYIPVHSDNAAKKDWIIVLEAGTIVGPSAEKLRVARATVERKIVRRYNIFLRKAYFLVVEGFDPRIHTLYFCPQLYRNESDKLVPLEGEEIGKMVAQAVQSGVVERRPWYGPSDKLPGPPILASTQELDTVIVDEPAADNVLQHPRRTTGTIKP
jgi:hypothetical protein